jgi:hypothetical protein
MAENWGARLELIRRRAAELPCSDMPPLSDHRRTPLDPASLPAIEAALGFHLPRLLTELYTEVSNGGFGPGYGLMALMPTHKRAFAGNAVAAYHFLRETREGDEEYPVEPALNWPVGLLPIVHMGCSVYYCVDCLAEGLPVFSHDCDAGDESAARPVREVLLPTGQGLADWLVLWATGRPTSPCSAPPSPL